MNILLLNWRCPKNPKSGGAEYIVNELLKHRVKLGDNVTWFAMQFEGAPNEEELDGIKIVRRGGPLTVQRLAKRWYLSDSKRFDLIIDQTHGLPFFATRWAQCPVLFYSNEVAGPIAKYMLPFPLGYLYQALEPWFVRQYKDVPAVSISESTTAELRSLGYRAPIVTMPLACDTKPLVKLPSLGKKEERPTLIFAARLVPLKRPDEAIKALARLHESQPNAQLWLIGKGEQKYEEYLRKLTKQLNLGKSVKFWGFVSHKQKQELMKRAHFVVITSIKEGWGLTVPEANALGTVGVTYNIAGVRDSNVNGKTGILTTTNTPSALAQAIDELWNNTQKYEQLRKQAWDMSKQRTWAKTEAAFDEGIKKALAYGSRNS